MSDEKAYDEKVIRYLGDVQRLQLGKDDVVVVTLSERYLPDETAKRIRDLLAEKLQRAVLVIPQGWTIGVLARESVEVLAAMHTEAERLTSAINKE